MGFLPIYYYYFMKISCLSINCCNACDAEFVSDADAVLAVLGSSSIRKVERRKVERKVEGQVFDL